MRKLVVVIVSTLLLLAFFSTAASASVYVNGYFRSDGTYVAPHYRSDPDSSTLNNWSTKGNINPYTGEAGTKTPQASIYTPIQTTSLPPVLTEKQAYDEWFTIYRDILSMEKSFRETDTSQANNISQMREIADTIDLFLDYSMQITPPVESREFFNGAIRYMAEEKIQMLLMARAKTEAFKGNYNAATVIAEELANILAQYNAKHSR